MKNLESFLKNIETRSSRSLPGSMENIYKQTISRPEGEPTAK